MLLVINMLLYDQVLEKLDEELKIESASHPGPSIPR